MNRKQISCTIERIQTMLFHILLIGSDIYFLPLSLNDNMDFLYWDPLHLEVLRIN